MMINAQGKAKTSSDTEASQAYEIKIDPAGFVDYTFIFERYLFNRAEHLATQRRRNPVSIGLWTTHTHRIAALLHLDRTGTEAFSPTLAPFGGIQVTPDIPPEALTRMLDAAENWCRTNQVVRLVIRTSPGAYDDRQAALLKSVYMRCGFVPTHTHANHHIGVTPTLFINRIRSSERRRLRKCVRAGFTTEVLKNPDHEQVYAFLVQSRQRQGYPFSMNFEQFRLLLTNFPNQAQVFVVKDGHKIISLTVGIRVSSKILYNFCPADNLDYRSYSPMVQLNGFLYEYAQRIGIKLIDLGVSLDHLGHEKLSLMRFKENLGAQQSEKVTYEKVFV